MHDKRRALLSKVPEITAFFWVTKLLTTAMGEATSDFMNQALGPAIAVPIMLALLGVALRAQLRAPAYDAWRYWMVVTMVAVFGTSAADALHVGFAIPYGLSSAFYAVVLAVVLLVWFRSERTLSIHSIRTPTRERFYWATVLATFALGTAAGDFTAASLDIGFLASAVLFASLFALPAVGHLRYGLNPIFSFWFAYIVTRPLGASIADWLDAPSHRSGLGLGTGPIAVALTVVMLAAIAYLAVSRIDVPKDAELAREEEPAAPLAGVAGTPALELD